MTASQDPDTPNQRSLARRLEVLKLQVVPMRAHGWLSPPDGNQWVRQPQATGVGPGDVAVGVWLHRDDPSTVLMTRRTINGIEEGGGVEIRDAVPPPRFVQPMPCGGYLLASARSRGEPNASVWNADGRLQTRACIGDAVQHVLSTDTGGVWVGYFDEAIGSDEPSASGLAKFGPDLSLEWTYPGAQTGALPSIFDCYSLNVTGETAHTYAYTKFHIVRSQASGSHDLGLAPYRGAKAVVLDGARAALVGGYGPDYDLVTPLTIDAEGVRTAGQPRRLVLPNGLELPSPSSWFARGSTLHILDRNRWFSISTDDLHPEARMNK